MKQRAIIAAVFAGLVAIVVVPLLILQYGRHHPSPPSLEQHPNPEIPGEILYFDRDGCVIRASASGQTRSVATCESAPYTSFVTWIDPNTIALVQGGGPSGVFSATTVDLRTGATGSILIRFEATDGVPWPPFDESQESINGERVSISEDGKVTLLSGTRKQEIADFDVARYRPPRFVTWSPDGEWMLLSYYDDGTELWVLSRDGETKGTLTREAQQPVASWYIEGTGAWPQVEVVS